MNRYYIAPDQWVAESLQLTDEEAHHCARVMRAKVGEKIEVFNGEGNAAICVIEAIAKDRVTLLLEREILSPKPATNIHLLQSIPKGKNMEWIIQKAVELGVQRITPIETKNTIVQVADRDAAKKQDKWQRIALEACKQCGQNWMPVVAATMTIQQATENLTGLKIVASLAEKMHSFDELLATNASADIHYIVGPEGDFTPQELEHLTHKDFKAVTLGDIVLRVETATMFGLSVLRNASLTKTIS